MGTQGSPKYYENGDPGPHFPMKMGTRGPQFGGSPFSHDTCTANSFPPDRGQQSVATPRPNVGGGIEITGCSHITVNCHTVTKMKCYDSLPTRQISDYLLTCINMHETNKIPLIDLHEYA